MTTIIAEQALLPTGWARNVEVRISADGRINSVAEGTAVEGAHGVELLLPAPPNLHSHTFQRAMAGLSESRGDETGDNFWTWRSVMYRFMGLLEPEDIQAIAAFSFMEMLEAGFASVAEFHYVHHQPGGLHYEDIAELSRRVVDGAYDAGIGLTLLPVFYAQGGLNGRPLVGSQHRFANRLDSFARLVQRVEQLVSQGGDDTAFGVAPHSLRAVSAADLHELHASFPTVPFHIHVAEQEAEVDEVLNRTGQRPVEWLLDAFPVQERWCLVHATHLTKGEAEALARSGAVAGLCPVTEANLGDGTFSATGFTRADGRFGVGTDSNIAISFTGELRQLEYSQRLRDRARAVLADSDHSVGRFLFDRAVAGGAQALGRHCGEIAEGQWADMVGLDLTLSGFHELTEDLALDAWIFAAGPEAVSDVWSAGRHMVREGRHVNRGGIAARYATTLKRLMNQW